MLAFYRAWEGNKDELRRGGSTFSESELLFFVIFHELVACVDVYSSIVSKHP